MCFSSQTDGRVAGEKEKEEEEVKKTLLVSAKQQCESWGNTTHVEISAPHNKCTLFKYTNRSTRFGTQVQITFKKCAAYQLAGA